MPNAVGPARWGLRLHVALVLLLLYMPLLVLIALSFNGTGAFGDWTQYSFGSYAALLQDPALSNALRNTVVLAGITTVIATAAGATLALGIHRVRCGSISGSVAFLPIVLPDIVVAIALLSLFVLLRVSLGFHSLVIAHGVFGVAFACAIVRARLLRLDPALIEASFDLGASEALTMRRIILPRIAPSILAAALVVFTLSANDFVITGLMSGPVDTVSLQIYRMIRLGGAPEINALSSAALGVSFVLILFAQRLHGESR